MSPTFESIRLAIETRLSTWDGVPVEYDGAPQSQDLIAAIGAKQSWVRCTILHGESRTVAVGQAPCVRRTGVLTFQVFTPVNNGSRPAALIADSLAQHFEFYQSGQFETQSASVQRAPPGDDYDWYQYTVMIPFRAG
ncbi:hypothetical protein AWR38_01020 [Idiomarina sp. WRN-38]|nr:hypothetical protein AUR68_01015 [Idiomarina sp. H105]OAE96008.1 hypothetical protein AWR38_01020 [Idiomarina sp. WRN-38]